MKKIHLCEEKEKQRRLGLSVGFSVRTDNRN